MMAITGYKNYCSEWHYTISFLALFQRGYYGYSPLNKLWKYFVTKFLVLILSFRSVLPAIFNNRLAGGVAHFQPGFSPETFGVLATLCWQTCDNGRLNAHVQLPTNPNALMKNRVSTMLVNTAMHMLS